MKTLGIAILLVFGTIGPLLAVEPKTVEAAPGPLTWEQVRAKGRLKSGFLKETGQEVQGTQKAEATPGIPQANLDHFRKSIAPVLDQKCLACHGPELCYGNLRIDKLDPNLLTGPDVERWREVYKVLGNSEMPPADESDYELAAADRRLMVEWLSVEMNKASVVRRNRSEHSSFRRMTKYEYDYALQDLLGLPYSLVGSLPPETASEDGFKNSSEMLQMSATQFETYREIALQAIRRVTVIGERPQPVTYIISMQEIGRAHV